MKKKTALPCCFFCNKPYIQRMVEENLAGDEVAILYACNRCGNSYRKPNLDLIKESPKKKFRRRIIEYRDPLDKLSRTFIQL